MTLPDWVQIALGELGTREVPGPAANPRIREYLLAVDLPAADDETPWCAAFVSFVLQQAGLRGIRSGAARSFMDWGKPTLAQLGAVTVLWRESPTTWQGHVGFLLDLDDHNVFLLGGNQRDRVSVATYPVTRVLGHRWPT